MDGVASFYTNPTDGSNTLDTDGLLSVWGARLFYPIPKGKGETLEIEMTRCPPLGHGVRDDMNPLLCAGRMRFCVELAMGFR